FGMDQSPLSLVVAVRSAPVALFVRCTVAPEMVAPLASVTLPTAAELELACPYAEGVIRLIAVSGIAAIKSANDMRHAALNTALPFIFCFAARLWSCARPSLRRSLYQVIEIFIDEASKVARCPMNSGF